MGRIRVLEESLINRIAAGEVVERPASVVKELVENSLDAGATQVEVRLEAGGRESIEVLDDGSGMDRDDALLCLERHATSKVRGAEELLAIRTLGFRGEALSSIAAVSHFRLQTATEDGQGTEVLVDGGKIGTVRDVGLPRGTTIQVRRLFFNVPARRKFLRSDGTELSHTLRWVTRYALAYPEKRFRVHNGKRRVLDAAPAKTVRERVAQIHGAEFVKKLLPFEAREGDWSVFGLAGRPVDSLPRRDAQHWIVNARAVQDRVLSHAVSSAYGNTMPPGRHPAVFLFLELPGEGVDVNVHPQKTEVRFRDPGRVHQFVRSAVGAAMAREPAVPELGQLRPGAVSEAASAIRESALRYVSRVEGIGGPPAMPGLGEPRPSISAAPGHPPSAMEAEQTRIPPEELELVPLRPLAQLRNSYIVAEDADGLVLVDQHAAHERVLFERFLADAEAGSVEIQQLLFPVTLEMAPADAAALEAELEEFHRLGFRLVPFGHGAVRVDAVPAPAAGLEVEKLVAELVGVAGRARAAKSDVAELRLRLVTSAACQAAIKIRRALTTTEMLQLLGDLLRCDNPTTCPHGRPVLFRLGLAEIERAFGRR